MGAPPCWLTSWWWGWWRRFLPEGRKSAGRRRDRCRWWALSSPLARPWWWPRRAQGKCCGVGMVAAISARGQEERRPAARPVPLVGAIFAIGAAVVVAKAGYVQVLRSDVVMGEGTLVTQADGARRYQYNPRLQAVMRDIPKGTIYDRNGLPLATSDWDALEKHRADYQALGIDIDKVCQIGRARHRSEARR